MFFLPATRHNYDSIDTDQAAGTAGHKLDGAEEDESADDSKDVEESSNGVEAYPGTHESGISLVE